MRGGVQTEEQRVGASTDDERGAPLGLDDEMFALLQDVSTSSTSSECRPTQPVWRPRFQFAGDLSTAPVMPVAGTDQVRSAAPGVIPRPSPLTGVEYAQALMRERMRARAAQPGPAPSFMSALAPPFEAEAPAKTELPSPSPAKKAKPSKIARLDKASATDSARDGGVGTSRSSYFRAKRSQKAAPGTKATSTGRQIGRPQKLDAYADSLLRAELARNPATELKHLQALVHRECNIEVSLSSISRRLKALGCSPAQQQSQARRALANATPAYQNMTLVAPASAGFAMPASSESSASRRTSGQSTASSSSRSQVQVHDHALPPGHAPEFEFIHDHAMQPYCSWHGEAEHSYAADGLDLTAQMDRAMQEFEAERSNDEASAALLYFNHAATAAAAAEAAAAGAPNQPHEGLSNGAASAYGLLSSGMPHNDYDFLNHGAARL